MATARRERLDKLLVERGFYPSREQAHRFILAGQVLVNEQVVDKPGAQVSTDAPIRVVATERYVSRGGYKLEAALDHFRIEPAGWNCLDIGASTGGFTDCLLQRGAARVVAVDVGHNQLAWKIRNDPRVEVYEGVNARYLENSLPRESFRLAVADLSFISLTLVLPSVFAYLCASGFAIVLIKPQFELEPGLIGKGGIVREPVLRGMAIEKVRGFVTDHMTRSWLGVIPAPILGAKGNQEYLACLR